MSNCFEDIIPNIPDSLVAFVVLGANPKHSTASIILWSVGGRVTNGRTVLRGE